MAPLTIVGGDGSSFPESSKAPSSTTTTTRKAFHRKVQSTISLCVIILLFTIVLFVLCTLDPSKVPEETWKLNGSGSGVTMTMIPHRPWRVLQETPSTSQGWTRNRPVMSQHRQEDSNVAALEGMGSLLRKGSEVMYELVVAHLSDDTTAEDLRLFLRGLHRSGMPARADVVLLFPWRPLPSDMLDVIHQEEEYFHSILAEYRAGEILDNVGGSRGREELSSAHESKFSVFNSAAYLRTPPASDNPKGRQDSIWGATATLGNDSNSNAKGSSNHRNNKNDDDARDNGVNHGAILAFDMLELDPDNALSGFIDRPPADLRRWVCYQILLGMVRHRYRHVFLTEVRGVFILKDILAPVKKKDNGLYLYYSGQRWGDSAEIDHHEDANDRMTQESSMSAADISSSIDHTGDESQLSEKVNPRKNYNGRSAANRRMLMTAGSELPTSKLGIMESVYGQAFWNALEGEDKTTKVIGTGVIMGGIRPVRSVAAAMATEIVRVALLRKNRKPFKDEALMSYLVHKSSVLGRKVASHLQIHDSGEGSINLVSGPPRSPQANFDDFFRRGHSRFAVIQGLKNPGVAQKRRDFIMNSLHNDICQSQLDSQVYPDCNTVVPLPST